MSLTNDFDLWSQYIKFIFFCLGICISYFSCCYDQISYTKQLKERWVCSGLQLKAIEPVMVGEAWKQECEATGHIASVARNMRPSYEILRPTLSDPFLSVRLYLQKVKQPSKTLSLDGTNTPNPWACGGYFISGTGIIDSHPSYNVKCTNSKFKDPYSL